MDDGTRAAVERAFKAAVNASLGVAGSDEDVKLDFIVDYLRAVGDDTALPAAPPVGQDVEARINDLMVCAPAIEKALSRALNRAANGSGYKPILCRVATFLENREDEEQAQAPSAVDAADWTAAYSKSFSKHKGPSKKRLLERSNSQILKEQSVVEYNEDRRVAQINGYVISRSLGKGAFGEVFLGTKDDVHFAVKVLKRNKVKKSFRGPPGRGGLSGPKAGAGAASVLDSVKEEIATLKKITHPNLVELVRLARERHTGSLPAPPCPPTSPALPFSSTDPPPRLTSGAHTAVRRDL